MVTNDSTAKYKLKLNLGQSCCTRFVWRSKTRDKKSFYSWQFLSNKMSWKKVKPGVAKDRRSAGARGRESEKESILLFGHKNINAKRAQPARLRLQCRVDWFVCVFIAYLFIHTYAIRLALLLWLERAERCRQFSPEISTAKKEREKEAESVYSTG